MRFITHTTFKSFTPPRDARKFYERPTTVIIDIDQDKEELIQLLNVFSNGSDVSLTVKIGTAIVHPQDQFEKKKGTQVAENNIQKVIFNLKSASIARGVVNMFFEQQGRPFILSVSFNPAGSFLRASYAMTEKKKCEGSCGNCSC